MNCHWSRRKYRNRIGQWSIALFSLSVSMTWNNSTHWNWQFLLNELLVRTVGWEKDVKADVMAQGNGFHLMQQGHHRINERFIFTQDMDLFFLLKALNAQLTRFLCVFFYEVMSVKWTTTVDFGLLEKWLCWQVGNA